MHRFIILILAGLLMACGGGSDGQTTPEGESPGFEGGESPGSEGNMGDESPGSIGDPDQSVGSDTDPGSDQSVGSDACPPPRGSADPCTQAIVFAKNPDTGGCCQYATACAAPEGWEQFGTEEACQ